jgi:hypothetical protein
MTYYTTERSTVLFFGAADPLIPEKYSSGNVLLQQCPLSKNREPNEHRCAVGRVLHGDERVPVKTAIKSGQNYRKENQKNQREF